MDREKSIAGRFAKTVKAALTTEEHDEMPTVPGTVAPPLVPSSGRPSHQDVGRLLRRPPASLQGRRSAADTDIDFDVPLAD